MQCVVSDAEQLEGLLGRVCNCCRMHAAGRNSTEEGAERQSQLDPITSRSSLRTWVVSGARIFADFLVVGKANLALQVGGNTAPGEVYRNGPSPRSYSKLIFAIHPTLYLALRHLSGSAAAAAIERTTGKNAAFPVESGRHLDPPSSSKIGYSISVRGQPHDDC